MKKLVFGLAAVMMCVSLAGCGGKAVDINELASALSSVGKFAEQLTEVSSDIAEKRYMISDGEVEECVSYTGTPAVVDEITIFKTSDTESVKEKAEQLKVCLANRLKDYQVEIEESFAQIGSGSQPMATIPSIAVTIAEKTEAKLTALLTVFKALEQPIIGRVEKGKIWLDLRSVADFKALLDTVEKL